MARQGETGAQRIQGLHDFEAPRRGRRQPAARRDREIAISPYLRAADPSPQLVKLRQPEHIRPVNDHRIHLGQVEP